MSSNNQSDDTEVSSGLNADSPDAWSTLFPEHIRSKFEIYSYRNAATTLAHSFPEEFNQLLEVLSNFRITKSMLRMPGGNKGPITKYLESVVPDNWEETRITADLHVKLMHAQKKQEVLREYIRRGYLDGHRIDFVSSKVALDFEWNSKDQTYDRDLYAFSAFYDAGAIDLGIILTRGASLNNQFFRNIGKVLKADGSAGTEDVFKKFGASTTWIGKLLYRLDAGRNGGCPILAIGITPSCVTDN